MTSCRGRPRTFLSSPTTRPPRKGSRCASSSNGTRATRDAPVATRALTRSAIALEAYDAIGRRRDRDLGDRPIDTAARLRDGTEFDGLDGLRRYLGTTRRDALIRQFNKKLLGYALGRGTQLSDQPLLEEMELTLKKNDYRFRAVLETVVSSRQFREIRGKDNGTDESRD